MDDLVEQLRVQSERRPPSDESGNVDVSVIDYNLSLTPAQRVEQHYQTRLFVERLRAVGDKRYGPIVPAAEATD